MIGRAYCGGLPHSNAPIMSAMSSATAGLLAEIDPLPYRERMRVLAGRARALSGSRDLTALLDGLYQGDRFQRQLAVFMAIVANERPVIMAALGDQDWPVQRAALGAWVRSGIATSPEITRFIENASWHARRYLYQLLRRLPRLGAADELIRVVWDRFGDDEAARLLPACSAGIVARLLPELGHAAGDWSLLGRRHPDVVVAVAGQQLAELAVPDRARWWAHFGAGVLAAAPAVPERVLDLLERYAPSAYLPGPLYRYADLAAADAGRLITLLTAPGRARWLARVNLPGSLLRCSARLSTPELAPLAQRLRENENSLVILLDALPPSRRTGLFDAAFQGVDRSLARPADQILDVLPRARRWAEARRVLDLETIRDDAALTLHYTAFLPWEQAQVPLADATRRAPAEDRATAYELLLACAARTADARVVTEAITYLQRLRNEQDPVRTRALAALARISPHLIEPQAADPLAQIASDALAARDASNQARHALSTLAVTVLREHVGSPLLLGWSLETLTQIFGDRLPPLGRIDTRLRRGQEAELFAAVEDWVAAGIRRGSYDGLFAIARALHRRAWRLPGLQEMLRQAIDTGNVSSVMRQAISLWLSDPASRAERVQYVVLTDTSTVTLHEVWAILCNSRTDLLDLVLTGSPPRGKFLAAGVRWVPLHASNVHRWLPRQHAAYASLLTGVTMDAGAKIYARTGAIAAAARIPGLGWDVVQRYLGSPNTSLAEAALAALAWTGRPAEALPILLRHADDDRARVAVYAARRAARFLSPRQLRPVLSTMPFEGKVTSRKEALRLAAVLSVPDVGSILLQAWARQTAHRDVRAAVVSAARQRLHDPDSWPILEQAASGTPEETCAVVAMTDPFACAPRHRHRYGQLISRACASRDVRAAQSAWLALSSWAHWAPEIAVTVTTRLTDLGDRSQWQLAIPPVAALLGTGQPSSALQEITGQLAALDHADTGEDPSRDRPARQRLHAVVDRAVQWAEQAGPDLDRTPLADAGHHLSQQPDLTLQAGRLLLAAGHPLRSNAGQLARNLADICRITDGQPMVATLLSGVLGKYVAASWPADPDALLAAAALLESDGSACAGLFAVALAQHGARLGWPPAWRAQIQRLRSHHLPDVRTAALTVVMTAE